MGILKKKVDEGNAIERFRKEIRNVFGGPFELGVFGAVDSVEKQPIWLSAINKTLTDEQRQKLKQHRTARDAFKRRTVVTILVSQFDERMFLTAEQRTKLTEILDRELGRYLVYVPPGQVGSVWNQLQFMRSVRIPLRTFRIASKKFLSDEQTRELYAAPEDFDAFGFLWGDPFDEPAGDGPTYGYLGINIEANDEGVSIRAVVHDSPADKAGLVAGDIITRVGDVRIGDLSELTKLLSATQPDEEIVLRIERDGETKDFAVELGRHPDAPDEQEATP